MLHQSAMSHLLKPDLHLVVQGPFTHSVYFNLNVACEWTLKAALEARAPLPFSLTVVSPNKLTLTNKITIFATARLP